MTDHQNCKKQEELQKAEASILLALLLAQTQSACVFLHSMRYFRAITGSNLVVASNFKRLEPLIFKGSGLFLAETLIFIFSLIYYNSDYKWGKSGGKIYGGFRGWITYDGIIIDLRQLHQLPHRLTRRASYTGIGFQRHQPV